MRVKLHHLPGFISIRELDGSYLYCQGKLDEWCTHYEEKPKMSVKIEEGEDLPPVTITIDGEEARKWRKLYVNGHLNKGCLETTTNLALCNQKEEILALVIKIGDAFRNTWRKKV